MHQIYHSCKTARNYCISQNHTMVRFHFKALFSAVTIRLRFKGGIYRSIASLVPRPFFEGEEEKVPGTHCLRMRNFPSKHWEFVILSIYYSVNVTLDLRSYPKNR